VHFQLRGLIFTLKPGDTATDRAAALAMFQRAAALAAHDTNAHNLVTTMQFALALGSEGSALSEVRPLAITDHMLQTLGREPDNPLLLANLQSAYRALLARPPADALTPDERRRVNRRLRALDGVDPRGSVVTTPPR
jgi:hypothetical protein